MIAVGYELDERSLVTPRESNGDLCRDEGRTGNESTDGESDTYEGQPREPVLRNRKSAVPKGAPSAPSSAHPERRISVAEHDSGRSRWKVTADKGNNTDFPADASRPAESERERRGGDADETKSKTKRRRKQRVLTICTASCKYEAVRRVAARFGMREVTEDSSWDLYWTDLSVSVERAKDMRRFQRVNHFPGMTEICRKDLLARNLSRMLKLFPRDYNFFPKTWCFPADHGDATAYAKSRRSRTFIVKPDTGCQGRGIYLTRHLKDIKPSERLICQVYIARPFLIDGYKFDLRIYALITSCDPLRIYVYNEGLARFATSKYKEPSGHNASNVFMHLTNYSVNKYSRMYVTDDEIGSKRKMSTLKKWLRARDVDVDGLWGKIDGIITKTVLAAYPVLKHSYHACFPMHNQTYACFELLGFDILLDWKLRPYLLEVNHSPSFHTDAQIDKDVKEALLADTLDILNLQQCDKKKIIEEDKKRIRERLLQGINGKDCNQSNDMTSAAPAKSAGNEDDYVRRQSQWEDDHMGNFRRIYPCPGEDKYRPFFTQNALSVFQDTVASRAREEASRIEREENELKAKEEERRRLSGKSSEPRLSFESPYGLPRKPQEKCRSAAVLKRNPEMISESEERERITGLAQRDFLIKSYGMLEQIYMAMKRNGTLRPADERKYGLYGRLGLHANTREQQRGTSSHRLHGHRHNVCHHLLDTAGIGHEHKDGEHEDNGKNSNKNLWITCNEALVYVRPRIPQRLWTEGTHRGDHRGRVTKAHVARTLSNTVRLHTIEKRESLHSVKSKTDVETNQR